MITDLTRSVANMLDQARTVNHADLINMPPSEYKQIMEGVLLYNHKNCHVANEQDVLNAMNVGLAVGYRWATRDLSTFDGVIIVTMEGEAIPPTDADKADSAPDPVRPASISEILRWIARGSR